MNNCRNCKEPVEWDYCPKCGQPTKLKRIDWQYIVQEIGEFFYANKGMIYTIRKVLISPGDSVREFLTEGRHRFIKPITFLFLTTLIYMLVAHLFNIGVEDISPVKIDMGEMLSPFAIWIMENPRYSITLIAIFVAFWLKIIFKKYGYNFFEIFILMCFVTGTVTLIDTLGAIFQGITNINPTQISLYIGIIYNTWAIGQFFDRKKAASYVKAFLSYIIGAFTLGIIIAIVVIIETAIK